MSQTHSGNVENKIAIARAGAIRPLIVSSPAVGVQEAAAGALRNMGVNDGNSPSA